MLHKGVKSLKILSVKKEINIQKGLILARIELGTFRLILNFFLNNRRQSFQTNRKHRKHDRSEDEI